MRTVRAASQLRVILHADEPRVVRQLDNLHQIALRVHAADAHAALDEQIAIGVVELVAVAMALEDILLTVGGEGDGIAAQAAGIFAQPHRAALLVDMLLVGHQVDHRVRRVGVNLAGVRAGQAEHVAGVFHHGHLHAQTNAQKRHAVHAGILHGGNLALQPALAEAARHEHAAPPRRPAQPDMGGDNAPRRRKKKKKTPLWLPFAIVMGVIAVISGVVVYGVSLVNKVEDSIRPAESAPSIVQEIQTAEEYKGDVVNILVCGIDFEEGRSYSDASSNDGMTDMILYCQFDIKGGALRMLQIPRNTLVTTQNRKLTLSNGKTYAVSNYQINSVALSNGGSIAALADVIYDQYHLPIDYYVTIDMQALVEMVDNFGGIEVYIPRDMSYGGSKLLKGYRNLDGASAEFFVRCRHGDGYANSDIDRLNMQRYFYAGLFKRARAMGITDILNQLPLIFKDYIHTDMDITTIAKLLASFLKIDSSNIILAQTPVFMGVPNVGKTDSFAGYSCVVPDAGSIANLLNQYFCTYTGPVEVSELHMVTDQWPHGSASTDANVQYMGRIDKESDDAILSGDTDLSGAVTTDGQAAGTGQ